MSCFLHWHNPLQSHVAVMLYPLHCNISWAWLHVLVVWHFPSISLLPCGNILWWCHLTFTLSPWATRPCSVTFPSISLLPCGNILWWCHLKFTPSPCDVTFLLGHAAVTLYLMVPLPFVPCSLSSVALGCRAQCSQPDMYVDRATVPRIWSWPVRNI